MLKKVCLIGLMAFFVGFLDKKVVFDNNQGTGIVGFQRSTDLFASDSSGFPWVFEVRNGFDDTRSFVIYIECASGWSMGNPFKVDSGRYRSVEVFSTYANFSNPRASNCTAALRLLNITSSETEAVSTVKLQWRKETTWWYTARTMLRLPVS